MSEDALHRSFDESLHDGEGDQRSRLSGVMTILIAVIPIVAVLSYGAVEPWSFALLTVLTAIMMLVWIADALLQKDVRYHPTSLQWPIIGLILICIVQLLPLRSPENAAGLLSPPIVSSLSLNPYATRFGLIQLVLFALFFGAALVYVNSAERLRRMVTVTIIFAALMAFFGILQRLANPEGIYGWRPTPQAIPFASFVNQHHFAAFMEMTIGLTLALLVGKSTGKDKSLLLVIAIVLMGIAVLLTGSRGGVLSLIGVVGFVLVTTYLRGGGSHDDLSERANRAGFRKKLGFVGIGIGLLVLLAGGALLLGGDASLSRSLGLTVQGDVSSGRLHFWSVAIRIFLDYPILGAGFDAFGTAYTKYDTMNGLFRVEQAHNEYLQTLADTGLLGFAAVIAFVVLLFKKGFQRITGEHSHYRRGVAIGALGGCFGILIHSFFDFPLRTSSNAYFFLLLAVFATAAIRFSTRTRARNR